MFVDSVYTISLSLSLFPLSSTLIYSTLLCSSLTTKLLSSTLLINNPLAPSHVIPPVFYSTR